MCIIGPKSPWELCGSKSVDLTLSNEFRYYKPGNKVVRVTEETNYEDITVKVEVPPGEGYLLLPGQLCLGITTENIKLAPGICGLLGTNQCHLRVFVVFESGHRLC
jgi:deoxycytidine triphosphate deaminase